MNSPSHRTGLRGRREREFQRRGDMPTVTVEVGVIAATNSDLRRRVAEGQFREDLFYRLNVIPVQLPPLRDRKEDIPLLVQHVFDKIAADRAARDGHIPAGPPMTVSQEAMRRLMSYHWPGNVRQLENAIERALAFSGGRSQIDVADLPEELAVDDAGIEPLASSVMLPEEGVDLDALVGRIERELIYRS